LTDVKLNQEQQKFYDKVQDLDFDKLLLAAPAGAGKTFVLTQALAQLHREGVRVLLCAPTHLARVNLLNKMPEDVRHEIDTATVASLLMRHGFTTDTGGTAFTRPKIDRLGKWEVIAIDECSMLGANDVAALQFAETKIIYTGDFSQLPTVMQKRADFSEVPVFNLVQQMRQAGPILAAAEVNRESVVYPTESVYSDDGNVIVTDSTQELLDVFYKNLQECSVEDSIHHRYIAKTNKEVLDVSTAARDQVHGIDSTTEPFIANEYILLYETCSAGYNGEVVKISQVKKSQTERFPDLFSSFEIEVEGSRGKCWITAIPPQSNPVVDEYKEHLKERINLARATRNDAELDFCFTSLKNLDQFFTKVSYPYAFTAHKSQGQSIANVYVNTQSMQGSNKRALLYVALSRATTNLYTVKVPPKRWEVIRKINTEYKLTKAQYEAKFKEPAHNFRIRYALKARTPEQKDLCTGMMKSAIQHQTPRSLRPMKEVLKGVRAQKKAWGQAYEGDVVADF
jgi:hypothetical protein